MSLLLNNLDQWQVTFDTISDFVLIIDPDHKILMGNRAICNYYGLTPADVTGLYSYNLIYGLDEPNVDCSCSKSKLSTIHEESEFTRYDRVFETAASPLYEDGKIVAFVHTLKDITEIKEQARYKAINETAGTVCHELTQPLQIISANISLINDSDGELPEAVQKRLGVIADCVNDMSSLVHKLQSLKMSRNVPSIPYNGKDQILNIEPLTQPQPDNQSST